MFDRRIFRPAGRLEDERLRGHAGAMSVWPIGGRSVTAARRFRGAQSGAGHAKCDVRDDATNPIRSAECAADGSKLNFAHGERRGAYTHRWKP
jgi:hypothetical protein